MHRHKQLTRWSLFVLLSVIVLCINLPIITMMLNSLRSTQEILSTKTVIPAHPSLENYTYVTARTNFWRYFFNSTLVAGGGAFFSILAATFAGYALSRFRSPVLSAYSRGLLMVQMFPIILALIPLFILFRTVGLLDSYLSVIILYTVGQLPFATAMFRAFYDGIPRDLEEAAQIDGASRLRAFLAIILPLATPAIAAVAIFAFLFSYNEYLVAAIFLRNEKLYTIPIGIQAFMQQYGTDWGHLMAASTLAMLPTFILFLFIQKYMMYGAIGSGVKG